MQFILSILTVTIIAVFMLCTCAETGTNSKKADSKNLSGTNEELNANGLLKASKTNREVYEKWYLYPQPNFGGNPLTLVLMERNDGSRWIKNNATEQSFDCRYVNPTKVKSIAITGRATILINIYNNKEVKEIKTILFLKKDIKFFITENFTNLIILEDT